MSSYTAVCMHALSAVIAALTVFRIDAFCIYYNVDTFVLFT